MGVLSGLRLERKALTGAPESDAVDGVMVALYPDDATAQALALPGGLTPEELHVTVAYLGKVTDVDRNAVLAATTTAAQNSPPIAGSYSGHARFTGTGDRGDALVALFDSPGLEQLRRDVVDALTEQGITLPAEHGFTAHTTLGYLPAGEAAPLDRLEPREATFSALSAVVGEDSTDMPLTGAPAAAPDDEPAEEPAEAAPDAAPPLEVKFDRDTLPDSGWRTFRKTQPINALFVPHPFTTETREGPISSPAGWLAVDSKGWPYPIATDEMATVYAVDISADGSTVIAVKGKPFKGAATPFGKGGVGGGKGDDAGPKMATGAFVALGKRKGRVDLVTTSGTVPGAKLPSGEDVEGSKDSPAARVVEYESAGDGVWKSTGKKFASSVAKLRRIPPLRTRQTKSLDEALAASLAGYYDEAAADTAPPLTAAVLNEVYERGQKSWPGDTRTVLDRDAWALGRVDAFVATATGQRPDGYHRDDDLLPRPAVPEQATPIQNS